MILWPWWAGALALGSVAVGFVALMRRPMGVSSALSSALSADERDMELRTRQTTEADLEAAMRAATLAAFGPEALTQAPADNSDKDTARLGPRLAWSTNVLFLVGIAFGAMVSAIIAGRSPSLDMGDTYRHFFGSGGLSWLVLLFGGVLVGFGTRMGGGCTSGHGLVGCARLRPGSLASTACFFGIAVLVSLALDRWAR